MIYGPMRGRLAAYVWEDMSDETILGSVALVAVCVGV
jgi:hypothetical protein